MAYFKRGNVYNNADEVKGQSSFYLNWFNQE